MRVNISKEEKDIWRKKTEYFIESRRSLNKRLEDSVYNLKKKTKKINRKETHKQIILLF